MDTGWANIKKVVNFSALEFFEYDLERFNAKMFRSMVTTNLCLHSFIENT